jgi:hypothetical protein
MSAFDRLTQEPTLVVEFVRALLLFGVVFGLPLTDAQTAATLVLVSTGLALLNRRQVTPITK